MTRYREGQERGAVHRAPRHDDTTQAQLERRRAEMHAAEGHAGSVPRGNQRPEREIMGSHRIAWERVLGH
jgi:hypothetical protein